MVCQSSSAVCCPSKLVFTNRSWCVFKRMAVTHSDQWGSGVMTAASAGQPRFRLAARRPVSQYNDCRSEKPPNFIVSVSPPQPRETHTASQVSSFFLNSMEIHLKPGKTLTQSKTIYVSFHITSPRYGLMLKLPLNSQDFMKSYSSLLQILFH